MKLTLSHLQQLGFANDKKDDFEICFNLLHKEIDKFDLFLLEEKKQKFAKVLSDLTHIRDLLKPHFTNNDLNTEIIPLADLQTLFSEIKPLIADQVSYCASLTDPYYIFSARNYGYSLKESYEQQQVGFLDTKDYQYFLASINALNKIAENGENFSAVVNELKQQINKISKETLQRAFDADRFNNSRGYNDAYRKGQKFNLFGISYKDVDLFKEDYIPAFPKSSGPRFGI